MLNNKRKILLSVAVTILLSFALNCFSVAYAQADGNTINYAVKKGDTFHLLSLRFNSTIEDISTINPGIDEDNLIIGSRLKLPIGTGIKIHPVKKGDTLWSIARKHSSTIGMITAKNYITDPNLIYIGDILSIPREEYELDVTALQSHIIDLLRTRDFKELAKYVHPVKGIRFSPYSYVDIKQDRVFTSLQVANFASDKRKYVWGYFDGTGFDIDLTPIEYFNKFVYDKDFAQVGIVSYNKMKGVGNTIENQALVYPDSTIVEYYIPGSEQYAGFDWSSLRLVFEKYNNKWYLVGIIHNQWTI
mgnify:CR=1 FL=1